MLTSDFEKDSVKLVRFFSCCRLLVFAGLLLGAFSAPAQDKPGYFDATGLRQPTPLSATWLMHTGDDSDGSKGWAQPGFDDSNWTPCDPSKSLHSYFPQGNPGTVWYRLHIKVAPNQTGLGLEEWNLGEAVSVFINGARVFHIGSADAFMPYTSSAQLLASIPADQIVTGKTVIAVRVHLFALDWDRDLPGLYPTNLILGQAEALQDQMWLYWIGNTWLWWLDGIVSFCLGIASILLYSAESRRREYLWLTLICAGSFIVDSSLVTLNIWNLSVAWYLLYLFAYSAMIYFSARMYLALAGRSFDWRLGTYMPIACLLAAYSQADTLYYPLSGTAKTLLNVPYLVLVVGIVPTALIRKWRRGNREAGILLIPLILGNAVLIFTVLLWAFSQVPALQDLVNHITTAGGQGVVGPFIIFPYPVASILFSLVMALIILLRTNRLSRQGAVFENELAAAREVQQVLVPEANENIAGFTFETAYIPAQQVGGDFFQILPTPNGGLLLVLGDVAGKGLPAAMLVSVLIGTIRTVVDYSHAPDQVLAALNSRMVGRSNGGFSTALAAHIDANGTVNIANAGHLSPYLNGTEIELPGALPLGILRDVIYSTSSFELTFNSRLTFYSDGVVEAQDSKGQLFGFERSESISTQPATVIAEQAKAFGQSDDITVIAIVRTSSPH